ncbi:hypothetical protein FQR65_LT01041 [Abscondita terminalis]|nr:hypothetical protein FQR65_LT01041 [Abscondita terminalis]
MDHPRLQGQILLSEDKDPVVDSDDRLEDVKFGIGEDIGDGVNKELNTGDFILVCLAGKKSNEFCVAQIIQSHLSEQLHYRVNQKE